MNHSIQIWVNPIQIKVNPIQIKVDHSNQGQKGVPPSFLAPELGWINSYGEKSDVFAPNPIAIEVKSAIQINPHSNSSQNRVLDPVKGSKNDPFFSIFSGGKSPGILTSNMGISTFFRKLSFFPFLGPKFLLKNLL